jgi:hypothetical protein
MLIVIQVEELLFEWRNLSGIGIGEKGGCDSEK